MNAADYPENDPKHHVAKIHRMLGELIEHCREDIGKIEEPKAQVLFETSAEVLIGLRTAYEHYATGGDTGSPKQAMDHPINWRRIV